MKKVLIPLFVLIIAVSACFVGCSNVNQLKMLSLGWQDYEQFVYNVYDASTDNPTIIGEMSYTFCRLSDEETSINGKAYSNINGGYVETSLNITTGEYVGTTMYSKVAFDSNFLPRASYKAFNSNKDELDYSVFADYTVSKKKGSYSLNDGDPVEFSRTKGNGSCYDNESLYSIIRASVFDTSNYSLSVYIPDNSSFNLKSVKVALSSRDTKILSDVISADKKFEEFTCTVITTTVPVEYGNGTSLYAYFSNTAYTAQGKSIVKVPVRIDEGNFQYLLKEVNTER